MATASAQLFVECGFCLRRNENLKDPRLLPCGHIHCSECLDGMLESNKFIACPAPNCKQVLNDLVHELPEANIGSQKSAHMCGVCKKKPATVYCTHECKKAFCLEHEKSHTDILPHHSTISIEEYSRLSRKHEKRVCSRHKNQPLVFGCRKCSQILCEDCDEPADCLGAPHQMATIKTLFKEAKQEVEPYRAKAEKRKDELSALLKDSERVLSTYRKETQEILELVKSTRDEQIRVLKDKYEQLTSEITKQREVTAEEIVKFRDEVVEEELSQLNMSLQRVVATLNNDHMVDVVQKCKKSKDDISSTVRKDLPGLSIEKGVGLKVKGGSEDIRGEIVAVHLKISIGRVPSAATAEPQKKQVDHVSLTAASYDSSCIPPTILAAVVTFEHKRCSGPLDRYMERYCQSRKNGGGDVSVVIYPWKGDRDQALVLFEEEFVPKDIVHKLASRMKPPITTIVEFVESQCFGCVTTCVSPALLEKLLTQYTVYKIVSQLELETGIRATFEESQNRLDIKGFYFQIKLAEECLNKLEDWVDSSNK